MRDLEVEFLLQRYHHAAEVLSHEIGEELGPRVALVDVEFGEDLVGEVGAGFEGEFFRQDEGVVAVEEDFGDLEIPGVREGTLGKIGDVGGTLGILAVV